MTDRPTVLCQPATAGTAAVTPADNLHSCRRTDDDVVMTSLAAAARYAPAAAPAPAGDDVDDDVGRRVRRGSRFDA